MNPSQLPQRLAEDGVDYVIADPGVGGTIKVNKQGGCVELVIAAALEAARVLPNPTKPGLELTISVKTFTASASTTVTGALFDTGDKTTVTFDAITDFAMIRSARVNGALKWVKVAATAGFS